MRIHLISMPLSGEAFAPLAGRHFYYNNATAANGNMKPRVLFITTLMLAVAGGMRTNGFSCAHDEYADVGATPTTVAMTAMLN